MMIRVLPGFFVGDHVPFTQPTLQELLHICYMIVCLMEQQTTTTQLPVVLVGNTMYDCSLCVACIFKYLGYVDSSWEGWNHAQDVVFHTTTSRHAYHPPLILLDNFDTFLEFGYIHDKPLLLTSICLEHVPLDDHTPPTMDVICCQHETYTSTHIFWQPEHGLVPMNVVLDGDFTIICRVGDTVIFSYQHHAAYCPLVTQATTLDLQIPIPFQEYFDDDFRMTLQFDAYWNNQEERLKNTLLRAPPPILRGVPAQEEGWQLIHQYHTIQPTEAQVQQLLRQHFSLEPCPFHLLQLALQLSQNDTMHAYSLLCDGFMLEWWWQDDDDDDDEPEDEPHDSTTTTTTTNVIPMPHIHIAEPYESNDDLLQMLDQMTEEYKISEPLSYDDDENTITTMELMKEDSSTGVVYDCNFCAPHSGDIKSRLYDRPSNTTTWEQQQHLFPHKRPFAPMLEHRLPHCPMPIEDPANLSAVEMLQRLPTNITLQELIDLQEETAEWNLPENDIGDEGSGEDGKVPATESLAKGELEKEAKDKATTSTKTPERNDDTGGTEEKEKVVEDDDLPLKEHPKYKKYAKMRAVGLPDGAIRNAMQRDEVDDSILDLDWDKSLKSQRPPKVEASSTDKDGGIPIKEDPKYHKYAKMRAVGLPDGAIRNAMQRDGVDESILDLDWEKSLESQRQPLAANDSADSGVPIKDDPRYQKYAKMRAVGLPDGAIRNAMQRDGLDDSIIELDWNKSLESQSLSSSKNAADSGMPIKDDPKYQKYAKMRAVGLPDGAIRNAMQRDGVDTSILELDWEKSLESQTSIAEDRGTPLKDDAEYTKYFKMLSMGLPEGAVRNALVRDGKDPSILDLDPERSVASQMKPKKKHASPIVQKKKVRRKKIFFKSIKQSEVKENSVWSLVKNRVNMKHLNYDVKEFEDLFTESTDPKEAAKKKKAATPKAKQKKAVQVIDGKRSMNGGIILKGIKLDPKKIAHMVEEMDTGKLDANMIKGLKEYLPTSDEKQGLKAYMEKFTTPEEKQSAFNDFSECEKYMYAMMDLNDAESKFDCMMFRSDFRIRFDELVDSILLIEKACDQVKDSERFHELLALTLTLVNEINTGGEGGREAAGFNLEALLKLNEAKAFDKKTSVLHYLVKLVRLNDESLLHFQQDLVDVSDAEFVVLNTLCDEIKSLGEELEQVCKTVVIDADKREKSGTLKKLSTEELAHQRTMIRNILNVPHYNVMDHLSGRTPMERFTAAAKLEIKQAEVLTKKVQANFTALLEFFGEDSGMASNDFFGLMRRFISAFGKAAEEVDREEKRRKRQEATEAKKREQETSSQVETTSQDELSASRKGDSPSRSEISGLAAAAAMVAQNRSAAIERSGEAKQTRQALAVGGIAAAAALAAQKRNTESADTLGSTETSKNLPSPFAGGGIAAAAAMSAQKRKNESAEELDEAFASRLVQSPFAGGGIAAAAAMAARKRNTESVDDIDESERSKPPSSPFAASGIAAAAAMAAKTRLFPIAAEEEVPQQQVEGVEGAGINKDKSTPATLSSPFAGQDIAAAAALAARKRAEGTVAAEHQEPSSKDIGRLNEEFDVQTQSSNRNELLAAVTRAAQERCENNEIVDTDDEDFAMIGESGTQSDKWAALVKDIQKHRRDSE